MKVNVGDICVTKGYHPDYDGKELTIIRIEKETYCYFKESRSSSSNNSGIMNIEAVFSMDKVDRIVNKSINNYSIF